MRPVVNVHDRLKTGGKAPRETLAQRRRVVVLDRTRADSSVAREIALASCRGTELWAGGPSDGYRMVMRSTLLIDKEGDDYGAAVSWFGERLPKGEQAGPLRLLSDPKLRIDRSGGVEAIAQQAGRFDWPTDVTLILSPLAMFLHPGASDAVVTDALGAISDALQDASIVVVQPVGRSASRTLPGWVLETDWDVVWSPYRSESQSRGG